MRVERVPADKQPAGDFEFRNVLIYGRKLPSTPRTTITEESPASFSG